jgi:hypothetical protein
MKRRVRRVRHAGRQTSPGGSTARAPRAHRGTILVWPADRMPITMLPRPRESAVTTARGRYPSASSAITLGTSCSVALHHDSPPARCRRPIVTGRDVAGRPREQKARQLRDSDSPVMVALCVDERNCRGLRERGHARRFTDASVSVCIISATPRRHRLCVDACPTCPTNPPANDGVVHTQPCAAWPQSVAEGRAPAGLFRISSGARAAIAHAASSPARCVRLRPRADLRRVGL